MKNSDKPKHQRWLYDLSDLGFFKAVLLIWACCWAILGLTMLGIKALLSYFK